MDAATAGLVGAATGGGVAVVVSFAEGRNQRRLEKAKAGWAESAAKNAEFRNHVAEVARELLSAQHSIEWFCALTDHGSQLAIHQRLHHGGTITISNALGLDCADQLRGGAAF